MQQKSHNHFCFQFSTVHSLINFSVSPFPLGHKGPPLLPRPLQLPGPAAPAYCTSFKALLNHLSISPFNLSNTPHTPSPASQSERKRRGLRASVDLPGNKDLENCVTKAVGHRADCCHCSALPLKISSASSYTSSCSLLHPRPTLNAFYRLWQQTSRSQDLLRPMPTISLFCQWFPPS